VQRREQERSRSFEARADAGPLHLVMIVTGEPPAETVQTLQGLQGQTTGRWMLTAVVHDSWHNDFTALLAVSGIQRSGQRVRVLTAGDGSEPGEMATLGLAATIVTRARPGSSAESGARARRSASRAAAQAA
jgi:hypothetical protein